MKKSILIGSLSGQNFAIETTKMDCTRGSFAVLFHLKHCRKKSHLFRGTVRKPVFSGLQSWHAGLNSYAFAENRYGVKVVKRMTLQ